MLSKRSGPYIIKKNKKLDSGRVELSHLTLNLNRKPAHHMGHENKLI